MRYRQVLLITAFVMFILGLAAAESADGEVLLTTLGWVSLGSAAFAGAHLD